MSVLGRLGRLFVRLMGALTLFGVCLVAVFHLVAVVRHFGEVLILPNGMIAKRQFGGGTALYSPDGTTRLASEIEFICFNDRYVWVESFDRNDSGLFDNISNSRVSSSSLSEVYRQSGLTGNRRACNGYITSMVDPELLFDGNQPPFLLSCDALNIGNPTLKQRAWFARPCTE